MNESNSNKTETDKIKTNKKEKIIVAITLVLILLAVNLGIMQKEQHLKQGESVYLELAPVDPRSLMQGDYMRINYAINRDIHSLLSPKKNTADSSMRVNRGFSKLHFLDAKAIVTVDDNGVGKLTRIDEKCTPCTLKPNEKAIAFRVRHHSIKIASNAFFFQEGSAKLYDKAKYAHVRLNQDHQPLLVGLLDAEFREINPNLDK